METTPASNVCPKCSAPAARWGKDVNGHQRFRCSGCKVTFAHRPARPLGSMRIPFDRAVLCLSILTEGGSIRGAERITGTHRDTICRLLVQVGGKCAELLREMVKDVTPTDVECDEQWSFVKMKQQTKAKKKITDPKVGDAYVFVGVDRDTKLVLAHHLGRRTALHADAFAEKLAATLSPEARPQLSTDGWNAYPQALAFHLEGRASHGVIVKEFASPGAEELRRYAPPRLISTEKSVGFGNPEEARIGTSRVERLNLTNRTAMKRLNRLTCGFSKKWANLEAAFALHFASYNLCKIHRSIRMTPAMKAGITRKPWSLADLVAYAG